MLNKLHKAKLTVSNHLELAVKIKEVSVSNHISKSLHPFVSLFLLHKIKRSLFMRKHNGERIKFDLIKDVYWL